MTDPKAQAPAENEKKRLISGYAWIVCLAFGLLTGISNAHLSAGRGPWGVHPLCYWRIHWRLSALSRCLRNSGTYSSINLPKTPDHVKSHTPTS